VLSAATLIVPEVERRARGHEPAHRVADHLVGALAAGEEEQAAAVLQPGDVLAATELPRLAGRTHRHPPVDDGPVVLDHRLPQRGQRVDVRQPAGRDHHVHPARSYCCGGGAG